MFFCVFFSLSFYNILSDPISSDQGTEFIIVGVDPILVIRKSEVFDIRNVSGI